MGQLWPDREHGLWSGKNLIPVGVSTCQDWSALKQDKTSNCSPGGVVRAAYYIWSEIKYIYLHKQCGSNANVMWPAQIRLGTMHTPWKVTERPRRKELRRTSLSGLVIRRGRQMIDWWSSVTEKSPSEWSYHHLILLDIRQDSYVSPNRHQQVPGEEVNSRPPLICLDWAGVWKNCLWSLESKQCCGDSGSFLLQGIKQIVPPPPSLL